MTHSPDIIIVGAGIIGCATAYELASRGAHVQILDARDVGLGATQASAGVLAPYIEAHDDSPLLGLATKSLSLYDDFIARLRHDAHGPTQYFRTGTLETAADEAALERLKRLAASLDAAGVKVEFLSGADACRAEPNLAPDTLGALLVHTHGFVSARDLTHALLEAASARGVHFHRTCGVRRLARAETVITLETDEGPLSAPTVILAAGSWTGQIPIDGGVSPAPVRPVRGQLLYLHWRGDPLKRVVWGPRCYLVPWTNGSLLVGATAEEAGFDERATVAGIHDLLDAVTELVPRAWQAGFNGVRVGLRPATPDELPIVGRSTEVEGLVYATGHYRNGILLAPLTARLVADLVLEDREGPELAITRPQRFGSC
jgi:glycine oxidase